MKESPALQGDKHCRAQWSKPPPMPDPLVPPSLTTGMGRSSSAEPPRDGLAGSHVRRRSTGTETQTPLRGKNTWSDGAENGARASDPARLEQQRGLGCGRARAVQVSHRKRGAALMETGAKERAWPRLGRRTGSSRGQGRWDVPAGGRCQGRKRRIFAGKFMTESGGRDRRDGGAEHQDLSTVASVAAGGPCPRAARCLQQHRRHLRHGPELPAQKVVDDIGV